MSGTTDRAHRLFAVATAVGVVHALDDAVLNRQPGVPVTQHLLALGLVVVAAPAAVWAFPRLRTGLQAVLALLVGGVMLANGGLHVLHVTRSGLDAMSGSDLTGLFAAAAGGVVLLLAAGLPVARRGERGTGPARRWTVRVLSTAGTVALVLLVVAPVGVGIGQTHLFRDPIGAPPTGFEAVTFTSTDGLELSGWYSPSRNGAAVVVVSSAGGDRLGSLQHARLLARHGYGVLTYDARGSGESEGSPNGYGWEWTHDVAGALGFLGVRPEVDPDRLGGLGLSTGADVLIQSAVTDQRLRAVVADGATARSFADVPPGDRLLNAYMVPVMATTAVLSGSRPGPPLRELAAHVGPTQLLLVAAGSLPMEIELNRVYADAAGEHAELWELPDAGHTAAIRDEAQEYERRVVAHLGGALLG